MSMYESRESARSIPTGWALTTVGDLASSIDYGVTASAKNTHVGPRFLRITDITPNGVDWSTVPSCTSTLADMERCRLAPNDLLFARIGATVGKSFLVRDCPDAVFASYLIRVRILEAFEPRFLFAYFQSSEYWRQINEVQQGIGRPVVNGSKLASIRVPVAPAAEQSRIADRIDELFTDLAAGVSALERVRAKLKRYRSAVLHAAVTGRLTAKWRAQHGAAKETGDQLLRRILIERRRQWEARTLAKYEQGGRKPPKNWRDCYVEPATPKTDDLLELPMDWCWATQDQVGEIQLGRQRSPQHHSGKHMRPYLRVANVYEDRINTDDVLQMNFTPTEFETYELRYGDILLNEGQSMELVGRPAMYRDEVPGTCFQNTLVRQRVFDGVSPGYALLVILAQFRTGRFRQIARITTSIAHLGAERFAAVEFPLPPVAEQLAIVETVQQKLSQIDAMEAEVNRGLVRGSRLRQATLKAAFAGKLVPQDPNDEPATVLLERIGFERLQAAAERNGSPKKSATKRRVRKALATEEPRDSKRKASRSAKARKLSASRTMKRKSR